MVDAGIKNGAYGRREQRQVARAAERAERRELPGFLRPGHFVRHHLERWSEKLWEREQAWHGFEALLRERGLAEEYEQTKEQQRERERGQVIEHQKFLEAQEQREQERGRGLSDEF